MKENQITISVYNTDQLWKLCVNKFLGILFLTILKTEDKKNLNELFHNKSVIKMRNLFR